ncbi:MAG TPA: glycosyltransferase [Nitrososphaeraceae archaeon]|nr:glycosyltransferase [Nitrososphaeraceae archaeon]
MKVLMVSTEYPPMRGGVGRYTSKLVQALRKTGDGIEVDVACNEEGDGEFKGISPSNERNSDVLIKIVEEQSRPDVVHVQFEPGLYGLILDSANPSASRTFIDQFYHKCKVPIVTTFHSAYTLREWMGQAMIVKREGRIGKLGIPARAAIKTWKHLVNYKAFHDINKEKLKLSYAGISFSKYMAGRLGGGHIIYHGAEPAILPSVPKTRAREIFSLPQDKMIAVAIGFSTATKGWDILIKIEMPNGWMMVLNSSKGHFNKEKRSVYDVQHGRRSRSRSSSNDYNNKIIDLQRGFLTEEELSMLFYASDVVMLPYKITSGSGVMFDSLAHRLPFVASDLDFFKEFAEMGLGITAKRDPVSFAKAIRELGDSYDKYSKSVDNFKQQLRWEFVTKQHIDIYSHAITERGRSSPLQ